jgi:hypothetical protein
MHFASVCAAYGRVPGDVIVKAKKHAGLSEELSSMVDDVFVQGLRQAVVARRLGVSRQRVNKVCTQLLESINHVLRKKNQEP